MKSANQKGCRQERWGLFRESPPWILVRLIIPGIYLIFCLGLFFLCLEGRWFFLTWRLIQKNNYYFLAGYMGKNEHGEFHFHPVSSAIFISYLGAF